MITEYDRVNASFERAVKLLQENLQYLANAEKVSPKFISLQNKIIKAIIDYQHQTETIISNLEWNNIELAKGKIHQMERLKDIQFMLEAICIIHRIHDFPLWMAKGKDYLVNEAVYLYHDNLMTFPTKLMDKINSLSKDNRNKLYNILHKEKHDTST